MDEIELKSLRRNREKHFLQKNGNIIAKIFNDDVHFMKEGYYEEIDNSLLNHEGYYYNKNNSYKVFFKEVSNIDIFKMKIDNHYINIDIKNTNLVNIKLKNNDSKLYTKAIYENLFNNIDLVYDIMPKKVKENIIIKSEEDLIEKISFSIRTDLTLIYGKDKNILALDGNKCVFEFETPYVIDSNGKILNNIYYELVKKVDSYELNLVLNKEYLINNNLKYPINVDPTITNSGQNTGVYETYIYPGDTNDIRYNQDILKVGVQKYQGKEYINRALIKFDLPKIGTGSQIINAELNLIGYYVLNGSYESDIVNIHQITSPWSEETANWDNMNDKYNQRIEGTFFSRRSTIYPNGDLVAITCGDDITNLVKKWYSNTPNYGIMLKANKEEYRNDVIPAFFSKDNNIQGNKPRPILAITYRNQNGLESYMDYKVQNFSIGSTYINSYNGNVCGIFNIGNTIIGKLPVSLNLVYNTNDVILNENNNLQNGFKFNLYQTIKEVNIDNKVYLEYVDEDGTIHYFKKFDSIYKDEDGLGLTIENNENEFLMSNKLKGQFVFQKNNNIGYLSKISDSDNNSINITYDQSNRITKIVDGDNSEIIITYEEDKIVVKSPTNTVYLNMVNNVIDNIQTETGIVKLSYNEKKLLSSIKDKNDLKIGYEYYEQLPYRIKKLTEYGIDNSIGNYFSVEYNFNSTTFIDNKDRIITLTFDNEGNVKSISNVETKENINNAYGQTEVRGGSNIENENEKNYLKNRLLKTELLSKYVNNYLKNTSFESDQVYFNGTKDVTLTISDLEATTGFKSLKVNNSSENQSIEQNVYVPKGNYYTFSSFLKNNNKIRLSLNYIDKDNNIVEQLSEVINENTEFDRYDITIYYPENAKSNLKIKIYLDTIGELYLDDIQLEDGKIANNYNLLENSNFADNVVSWELGARDIITGNDVSVLDKFEIVDLGNGINAFKVKMKPEYNTEFFNKFKVCGKGGDTYYISFWYKNQGLVSESNIGATRYNNLIINFHYIDDSNGHCDFPSDALNVNENEWQYFSAHFTAEKDFDYIKLTFFQGFNANDFYVTNMCLFKDFRSVNYEYDEMGNIKSVKSLDNNITKVDYNKNNMPVNIYTLDGKNICYEYDKDSADKIINEINTRGLAAHSEYDNNGNIVVSRLNKKDSIQLEDNFYKIRLKGTNKYLELDNNLVILKESKCDHTKWKLKKENDNYKIQHYILDNKFLTIKSNFLVLYDLEEDSKQFNFSKNDDGSYHIKFKDKYLKVNNDNINLVDFIEVDENSEFYLEKVFDSKFLEKNLIYTEDGKLLKSSIDTNLNKSYYEVDFKTGLTKSITNPKNQKLIFKYNSDQKITEIIKKDKVVSYRYNNKNLLDKVIHGTKEYKFEYDNFLNLNKIKIGDNITLVTNIYENNNGNLLSTKYGNNQIINYQYDKFDRLSQQEKMDDTYSYEYDNNGNISKILSNRDKIKIIYDMTKRIKKYSYNDLICEYIYNSYGNIIDKKYKFNNLNHKINNIYDDNTSLIKTIMDNNEINYSYDSLDRLKTCNINDKLINTYSYVHNGNRETYLIKDIKINDDMFSYKYDKLNNITHVYFNNKLINKYYYNYYNELIREDNYNTMETIRYKYDLSGNILTKRVFELDTYNLKKYDKYEYGNVEWEDQLTSYNGEKIVYDLIGNPVVIGNKKLEWINGKELKRYSHDSVNVEYQYNHEGLRTKKVVNGIETNYYFEGKYIVMEKNGNELLYFMRDDSGELVGFNYKNEIYYYLKNLQDDIIGIADSNGNIVVKYSYDSWGNILSITDGNNNDISTDVNHIGNINPFRYRSYYYDKETNLYYLSTRYYNPVWGRFLNSDKAIGMNDEHNGYNLYCYCNNNPINNIDSTGLFWKNIKKFVKKVYNQAKKAVKQFVKSVGKLFNDIGKGINTVVKTVQTGFNYVKKACNFVKNSFVLDAGAGIGFSGSDSMGATLYEDITFKIEEGKFKTGNSMVYGGSVKNISASKEYFHEYHFDGLSKIDDKIEHSFVLGKFWEIINCNRTDETTSASVAPLHSIQMDSNGNYSNFIGISIDAHFIVGFHFSIGFEI